MLQIYRAWRSERKARGGLLILFNITIEINPDFCVRTWRVQEQMELWNELCAQAAVEQDPKKLQELVRKIADLLEAKQRRLSGLLPPESQA